VENPFIWGVPEDSMIDKEGLPPGRRRRALATVVMTIVMAAVFSVLAGLVCMLCLMNTAPSANRADAAGVQSLGRVMLLDASR
jgi:hypothetical protein